MVEDMMKNSCLEVCSKDTLPKLEESMMKSEFFSILHAVLKSMKGLNEKCIRNL